MGCWKIVIGVEKVWDDEIVEREREGNEKQRQHYYMMRSVRIGSWSKKEVNHTVRVVTHTWLLMNKCGDEKTYTNKTWREINKYIYLYIHMKKESKIKLKRRRHVRRQCNETDKSYHYRKEYSKNRLYTINKQNKTITYQN